MLEEFLNEKCFTRMFRSFFFVFFFLDNKKQNTKLRVQSERKLFYVSLLWLLFHLIYQKQKNHNETILFLLLSSYPRRHFFVYFFYSRNTTWRTLKWTNKNARHFKQFACFFASLPSHQAKDEIFMRICTFLWVER